jgi:hypothetical protein
MRWCRGLGLAGLALAAGCATTQPAGPQGPKVYDHTENERWFTVPTRCGQGPYEIELMTIGGRWQEVIVLQVESRQRVRLTAAILVDDTEVARTTDTLGLHAGEGPENQFCIAAPTDVAQAMQPAAAAGGAIAIPRAPGSAAVDLPAGPAATLIPAERPQYGGTSLVRWSVGRYGVPDVARKGGQRVRIRFWSDLPNDFGGTRIGFVHERSWQLPPTADLRWQPPRWMYRRGVFVFVPGGWVSVGRP